MGRYFAAPCGYYITRIDDIKNNDGENFIIVDGGMNMKSVLNHSTSDRSC